MVVGKLTPGEVQPGNPESSLYHYENLALHYRCNLNNDTIDRMAEVMAIKQPKPFKPLCLTPGAKRVTIIGELGQPVNSEMHTNSVTDVYKYVDGGAKNDAASKTSRIIVYVAGDFVTLFLDQVVWIPTEAFGFAGTDHAVTVDYLKAEDDSWHANRIDDRVLTGNSTKKQDF